MSFNKAAQVWLLSALATGLAFGQSYSPGIAGAVGQGIRIPINPQNGSGENGSAILYPEGNQTRVVVNLKGVPEGTSQPAHIHEGTCANLDPKPKYGLQAVTHGRSDTVAPVSADTLLSGPMAVNVHRSANDISSYVACGDLKRGGG